MLWTHFQFIFFMSYYQFASICFQTCSDKRLYNPLVEAMKNRLYIHWYRGLEWLPEICLQ